MNLCMLIGLPSFFYSDGSGNNYTGGYDQDGVLKE